MATTEITVLGLIDTTHEGPVATGPDGEEQRVHLMQGSVDGACGPYCLFMALLALGLVAREDLLAGNHGAKKKGGLAKLLRLCDQYGPFFQDGTNLSDLTTLVKKSFGKKAGISVYDKSSGNALKQFVTTNVEANRPVVLGIDFSEGAHWVLVVGLEYAVDDEGHRSLCRFLVLDPGDPAPTVCAWNGVIDARGSGGPYPYTWWTSVGTKVKFTEAMAVGDLV
jgi:hypothetical protein